jgi:S-adenosylmethionine-dependent methyltransferase
MIICVKNTNSATVLTALTELETRYCRQEPFVSLGRYIHVTAHKPQMQG